MRRKFTGLKLAIWLGLLVCAAPALAEQSCPGAPASIYCSENADGLYPATCADGVDTVSALSLVPDKDKAIWTRDDQVSAASACIRRGGAAVPYLVYALPPAGSARMVEVGAVREPTRVVSPEVVLLDEAGNETRSFARESYMFRPGLYSVQFVPAANERFALVMVDPAPIGKTHDTITLGTSSTMVYTGFGVSNWPAGNEARAFRRSS